MMQSLITLPQSVLFLHAPCLTQCK